MIVAGGGMEILQPLRITNQEFISIANQRCVTQQTELQKNATNGSISLAPATTPARPVPICG